MEKFTLDEFLGFPEMEMSEIKAFLKKKGWLNVGETPHRKTVLERVYQAKEMHFFEYRISKKTGHTWTNRLLEQKGQFERTKLELTKKGFKINEESELENQKTSSFRNNELELKLIQFPDMGGKECFHLVLKKIAHNTK